MEELIFTFIFHMFEKNVIIGRLISLYMKETSMKQQRTISKLTSIYLLLPMILGALFLAVGFSVMKIHRVAAVGIIIAVVIYLIISFVCYERLEKIIQNELLSAGFEQSQIQRYLLKNLPLPYIVTNGAGNQIWYNNAFVEAFGRRSAKKTITQMFPEIYRKIFPEKGTMWDLKKEGIYQDIWQEKEMMASYRPRSREP